MRTLSFLPLAFVALYYSASAQREQLVTRTYTEMDGLPSRKVLSVSRDSLGIVWVGTSTGLAVSFGAGFVAADQALIISLPPSSIANLSFDKRHSRLLAAGSSGTACVIPYVQKYPYRRGYHVKHVTPEIADNIVVTWDFTCILGTSQNEVLLGTQRRGFWARKVMGEDVDLFSFSRQPLRRYGNGLTVSAIVEDSSNNIWVGTTTGLYGYLDSSLFPAVEPLSFLRRTAIAAMNVDQGGGLWIATANRAVYYIPAGHARRPVRIPGLQGRAVVAISCATNGDVWFASATEGLVRLRNGIPSVFTRSNGLPTNSFHSIFVDDEGLVWAGSNEGLTKILPASYLHFNIEDGLPHGGFFSAMTSRNGDLWFSGAGTLVRMRGTQIKYWRTPPPFTRLALIKLLDDDKGNIWTLSVKGVVRFDGSRFTLFPDSLKDELYTSLSQLQYHPSAGVMLMTPAYIRRFRNGSTTTFLNGERLNDMRLDGTGNAWVLGFPSVWKITPEDSISLSTAVQTPSAITTGPDDSVFVLDREFGFFPQSELESSIFPSHHKTAEYGNNRTRGFYPEGLVTKSGRMFLMNAHGIFEQGKEGTGNVPIALNISSIWVAPIFERSDGSVLLGTSLANAKGIHLLTSSTLLVVGQPLLNTTTMRELRQGVFGSYNLGGIDLPNRLHTFTEDSSGTLWTATPGGIFAYPRTRKDFSLKAPVVSRLVVDNDMITAGTLQRDSRFVLSQPRFANLDDDIVGFANGQRVILPPSKNNLVFFLNEMSFQKELGAYFQYRLDGVDSVWSTPSVNEEARYFDVAPGTHQFRARTVSSNGILSQEYTMLISIIVPYWKSSWFISLALISTLYVAGRAYAGRIRHLREEGDRSTIQAIRTNEMRMAQSLQAGMLPAAFPQIIGYEFTARSNPASEVGGDFYDFLADNDRLGIVLGDVSGHGITGAMIVGMARTSLRFASSHLNAPAKILSMANERLRQDISRNVFVATFYGILEPKKRNLRYICAGLPTPILLRNGRATHLPPTDGDRFPLGILSGVRYKEAQLALRPNDLLIFYTDGIVEAMNRTKDEFGFDRLLRAVEGLGSTPINSVANVLLDEVVRFTEGAPQDDDVTLVAFRVTKGGRS